MKISLGASTVSVEPSVSQLPHGAPVENSRPALDVRNDDHTHELENNERN